PRRNETAPSATTKPQTPYRNNVSPGGVPSIAGAASAGAIVRVARAGVSSARRIGSTHSRRTRMSVAEMSGTATNNPTNPSTRPTTTTPTTIAAGWIRVVRDMTSGTITLPSTCCTTTYTPQTTRP